MDNNNNTIGNTSVDHKLAVISFTVYLIIEIVALAANGYFIYWSCFENQRKLTRTSMYMVFVAITHLGVAMCCIPFIIVSFFAKNLVVNNETACYISGIMIMFWFTLSVYSMTILSWHKYYSITHPLSRFYTHKSVAVLVTASVVMSALVCCTTVGYSGVSYEEGVGVCTVHNDRRQYFTSLVLMFFCFILPVLVNIFTYWRTVHSLSQRKVRLRSNSVSYESAIVSQRYVTHTLYISFALHTTCWIPFFISWVYMVLEPETTVSKHIRRAAYTIGCLSIAINPVVYIVRNDAIFRNLILVLKCHRTGKKQADGPDRWLSSPYYSGDSNRLNVYIPNQSDLEKLENMKQSDV